MQQAARNLLVVGGNGFIGSAVCKAALARGFQVTSVSSSGRPFRTPKGHTPAWTAKVNWQTGDARNPETFAHLLPGASAVVHTLGTLLEDSSYKGALRSGDAFGAIGSFLKSVGPGARNPLTAGGPGSYEDLNRDCAVSVAQAFLETKSELDGDATRAFVYLSAEDIFRPWIPARYIETKREAEIALEGMFTPRADVRGVYIRPSLVYHPHFRPLTSPVAAALDLSAVLHEKVSSVLPTPSGVLRALSPHLPGDGAAESVANALTLPPIHVDHVAEACCVSADPARVDVRGAYGVRAMRELIGWAYKGQEESIQSHI